MLILKPIAHETIWGGEKLKPYAQTDAKRVGHLYGLFDDVSGSCNEIANGALKGQSFHTFFEENKGKYGLSQFSHFPLVICLVEAQEALSVQVHPDDECARRLESVQWGKNESWYFLEAPASGSIYCGCTAENVSEVRKLLREDRIDLVTARLPIHRGDYVFIPAGTLHSMSAGSLVYEIEENSEFTYRFFDFNRKDAEGNTRELHIEKALQALKPENRPSARRYEADQERVGASREIRERMYATRLLSGLPAYRNVSETLEVLTILDPSADFIEEGVRIRMGTTLVLLPGEEVPLYGKKTMMARPSAL